MKNLFICMLALFLSGCADMNMNIQNPFASSSDASQVYYDEFPDVPIPGDMQPDRSRSWVSVTPEGVKIGLVTTEGRYDMASLATATIHNMTGQGWGLRAMSSGPRIMQVYEKDNRVAVVYFYKQTTSVAMELWLSLRLPDGVVTSNMSSPMSGSAGAPAGGAYGNSSGDYTDPGAVPLTQ